MPERTSGSQTGVPAGWLVLWLVTVLVIVHLPAARGRGAPVIRRLEDGTNEFIVEAL